MKQTNPALLLFILSFSIFISACGEDNPFVVDYSAAPAPFPIENAEKVETESGLTYYIIEEGQGEAVIRRNQLEVYYTGRTMDNNIFDSSYRNGSTFPATFDNLGTLIAGFTEGLIGMKEGEKRVLIIPKHLAYGNSEGHRLQDETLRFDLELAKIVY